MRKLPLPSQFRRAGEQTPRGTHLGGIALDASGTVRGQLTFPQGVTHDAGEHADLIPAI